MNDSIGQWRSNSLEVHPHHLTSVAWLAVVRVVHVRSAVVSNDEIRLHRRLAFRFADNDDSLLQQQQSGASPTKSKDELYRDVKKKDSYCIGRDDIAGRFML